MIGVVDVGTGGDGQVAIDGGYRLRGFGTCKVKQQCVWVEGFRRSTTVRFAPRGGKARTGMLGRQRIAHAKR